MRGRVRLPWTDDLTGHQWLLRDGVAEQTFRRAGDELGDDGLYVALEPWSSHVLTLTTEPASDLPGLFGS